MARAQSAQVIFCTKRERDFGTRRRSDTRVRQDRIQRLARRDLTRPSDQRRFNLGQGGFCEDRLQERQRSHWASIVGVKCSGRCHIVVGDLRHRERIGSPEGRFSNRRRHWLFRKNARNGDGGQRKSACDHSARQNNSNLHVAPSTSSVSARRIFGTANSLGS